MHMLTGLIFEPRPFIPFQLSWYLFIDTSLPCLYKVSGSIYIAQNFTVGIDITATVNPRPTCARVTVVVLCVCVCLSATTLAASPSTKFLSGFREKTPHGTNCVYVYVVLYVSFDF